LSGHLSEGTGGQDRLRRKRYRTPKSLAKFNRNLKRCVPRGVAGGRTGKE
jgi:hypothetical protein